jgi:hypothetical protein
MREVKSSLVKNKNQKNQKNAQIPTGIMISTKKQFHLLGENQRQPSPSLTNQTFLGIHHPHVDLVPRY